jgi:hypothetical protein
MVNDFTQSVEFTVSLPRLIGATPIAENNAELSMYSVLTLYNPEALYIYKISKG